MQKLNILFSAVAVLAVLGVMAGCETESASARITISPSESSLRKDQSVTLTASGGYDYEWSLATEDWGTLSRRRGDSTTYTSLYEPGSNNVEVQVITVTSVIEGNSSTNSGTNSIWTSEAYVKHISSAD